MTIKKVEVVRDQYGFWTHPEFPDFGEHITRDEWELWCAENNIKGRFVYFEFDASDELQDKLFEDGDTDCSAWEPTKPADNAFLLALHATEDGPIAIFAIPVQEAA